MSQTVQVSVETPEPITIEPAVTTEVVVEVGAPEPLLVDVTQPEVLAVEIQAVEPITVDVTTLGAPGLPGADSTVPGPPGVGLREVYLNDEPVPDGVSTWLRVRTDPVTGEVNEILLGVADA